LAKVPNNKVATNKNVIERSTYSHRGLAAVSPTAMMGTRTTIPAKYGNQEGTILMRPGSIASIMITATIVSATGHRRS
jgi:hypothetical protein